MNILIRADASPELGGGHIMRCVALASILIKHDQKVTFISKEINSFLEDTIRLNNINFVALDSDYDENISDTDYEDCDIDSTIGYIINNKLDIDFIIVDHYKLNEKWERSLKKHTKYLMVIDDLPERKHICDFYLNQNNCNDQYAEIKRNLPDNCIIYLGPKYALLRSEYYELHKIHKPKIGIIKRIFVCFGATDPTSECVKVANALKEIIKKNITVDVVLGDNERSYRTIEKSLEYSKENYRLHRSINDIAELMMEADIAIGSGGTMMWERMCLGMASIVITISSNQEKCISSLSKQGYIEYLGNYNNVNVNEIEEIVNKYCSDPGKVAEMSSKAYSMVDGKGTMRVANHIIGAQMELRYAEDSDKDKILEWRNSKETRKYSVNKNLIAYDEHVEWFSIVVKKEIIHLLVAEINEKPIGVLRFDIDGDKAKVSIYLVPGEYNKGYGTIILIHGNKWINKNLIDVTYIEAEIKEDNIRSRSAFVSAGYERKNDKYIYMVNKSIF